jgi:hypothetical protein
MIRGLTALLALLTIASRLMADNPAPDNVQADLLEGSVLRYRVASVTDELAAQLARAQPTNRVSGLVLDLRFTGGTNATAGDCPGFGFFAVPKAPLVILVNSRTSPAAATLASRLQAAHAGLVIGGLRASPAPDLTVPVNAEAETNFLANPYLLVTNAARHPATAYSDGTNDDWTAYVDHTSEADLVRKRVKDGEDNGEAVTPRTPAPPVIQDPALARAVDLLKALAALHPSRG